MTNRHPRPRLAALVAALSITLLSDPFHIALAANLISTQDAHSIGVRPTCISIFLLETDITRQQLRNVAADKEANWLPTPKGAFNLATAALCVEERRSDQDMEPVGSNEANRANTG